MKKLIIAVLAGLVLPSAANAALTVNIVQDGANVTATLSGSLSLSGLTFVSTLPFYPVGVTPSSDYIGLGAGGIGQVYTGFSSSASWGTTGLTLASSSSGNTFAFQGLTAGPAVLVPAGFVSGSALSATSTFNGTTLAALGLNTGTYVYVSPGDTITVNIGGTGAVPEPTTWAMMIAGFGLVGSAMRRRQTIRVALA